MQDLGFATMVRSPGYGDHLEATVDPEIRARQVAVGAPAGFEDVVASAGPPTPAPHRTGVSFPVADRDRAADLTAELGAEVLSTEDSMWTRTALIRDPAGAVLSLTRFTPPGSPPPA